MNIINRLNLILLVLNLIISIIIVYCIEKIAPQTSSQKEYVDELNYQIKSNFENEERLKEEVNKINSYTSHELKNMLNVLSGQIQLKKNKDAINQIAVINETIEDINALTAKKINLVKTDLLTLTAEVCDKYKNIKFDFTDDEFIGNVNPSLYERVLINIINNAFNSNAKNVYVYLYKTNNNNNIISIKNDGDHLSLRDADNIFEHGFKIKENGRGIGLNLVKNVIDQFNGSVNTVIEDDIVEFILVLPSYNETDHK